MATEYRVALIGKAGTGKSSLGNSLLGKKAFQSKSSGASITQWCELGVAETSIGKLSVVDTPGLFDTNKPNDETVKELIKCVALLAPGPHVFIMVLSMARLTREDLETVNILKQILGKNTLHHAIVVFTRKDDLDDDMTVEEFIDTTQAFIKNLLQDVNNRYEFICNKVKNDSHRQDVQNILSLITNIVQQNGGNYYTQDIFQAAEEVIQKEIRERQQKENKPESEYRSEIKTDIVNNKTNIFCKIFKAVIGFFRKIFGLD